MSGESVEVLQARMAMLERRLQFLSEELHGGLSRFETPPTGDVEDSDFSSEVAFDADSISQFAQGFYEREYDHAGRMFRWTGYGPFCELRFFIDRSTDRPFRIDIGATPQEVAAQVEGFVDYAAIPLTVEEDGENLTIVGTLPKRSYTRLAVLTFLLGSASGKKKHKAEEDQWLGFRFYSLKAG
jgi:hypothetical protein